ncbi:MAG: trigger factor [Bacillota bacterium]|jgi:trigger factor
MSLVSAVLKEKKANVAKIEVVAPASYLDLAYPKAVKAVGKDVKIPGFRSGHVPQKVLENFVGQENILQQAFEDVFNMSYEEIFKTVDLLPVDRPAVDISELELGKDVKFDVVVVVKPEATLGEYKGVEVHKIVEMPTAEDVDAEIKKMQERVGKMETLGEGAAVEKGDIAVIDFEGFQDGVAFEGGKGENYPLNVGSNTFIPGFEDQIVGAKAEEEVEVNVTFPENYQAANLAGKPAVFKVKVHEIRRRNLPELNDEFVKDVREDCDTVEDLKTKLMEELTEKSNQKADELVKRDIMTKVVDGAEVDIPHIMIENKIDDLVQEFAQNLQYQGLTLEKFFELAKTDMAAFREHHRERAEHAVKQDLVLEAVAKAENIEATDEDIDKQIADVAKSYNKELDEVKALFKQSGSYEYFAYNIKLMKALDFINDNAVIK